MMWNEARLLEDGQHCRGSDVIGQFFLGGVEIVVDLPQPVLEDGDETDAPVDWVFDAGICFVGQGIDGVFAVAGFELVEDLPYVAGAEYFVDVGELLGLVGREIGS